MENQTTLSGSAKKNGVSRLFSIKPYGENLCTPGASYWIACVRLVIIVMALSEAIAWGYLGSLFGRELVGYAAAAIAFLFVFTIIWIIDVSFVTLDLSRAHYDRTILNKKASSWLDNIKLSIGLLGRVTIVVVSLSISAPFIAQIVFMQDIDNEMERQNLAIVSEVSDSLMAEKEREVAAMDSLILAKETELIEETAGIGTSGNYGFGPVTQAMERNIQRLKDERAARLAESEELAESLRSLSVEEFADQYNVDLVDNGVQARSAILAGLSDNPEYRTTKNAITAFLSFIFGALVLLKLFQPRSVRIYYNEKLQDLYREYLSGNLNKWIATEEQYRDENSFRMSPLRFEDWCVNTYGVIRGEDIHRRESSKLYNIFKMKIEHLESERNEVSKMLDPLEADYEARLKEYNDIRIEWMQAENAIQQNERMIADSERQLKGIESDLEKGLFRGEDLLHAVQAKKNIEDRLAQQKVDALQLQYDRDIVNHRYEVKRNEIDQLEELMARIRENHRQIQEKIDQERLTYTDLIVSGEAVRPVDEFVDREEVEPDVVEIDERDEESVEVVDEHRKRLSREEKDQEDEAFEYEEDEWLHDDLEKEYAYELAGEENEKPVQDSSIEQEAHRIYPLLLKTKEGEELSDNDHVEYVDEDRLKRYADEASMTAYEEESGAENSERKEDIEERNSDDYEEGVSRIDTLDAPEAAEEDMGEKYTEREEPSALPFEEEKDRIREPSRHNAETRHVVYALDTSELQRSDHQKPEDEETLAEGTEEVDRPENGEDTGETTVEEKSASDDDDAPEKPDGGQGRKRQGRAPKSRRALGVTGDWMIS